MWVCSSPILVGGEQPLDIDAAGLLALAADESGLSKDGD
jgi:hypothetical protein